MSEFAKKFFDLVEGRVSKPPTDDAQKEISKDGADHNRQQQNLEAVRKEAARTSEAPREEGVSGFFGRVELTEETPDGKTITHVKGCQAGGSVPASSDTKNDNRSSKTDRLDSVESQHKYRFGNNDFDESQVVSQNWDGMYKAGQDALKNTTALPELLNLEKPKNWQDVQYPHLGNEDQFVDYDSCKIANQKFPKLAHYAIDADLIAATIRNEQFYYMNGKDVGPDHYIAKVGAWPFNNMSIGPAQMKVDTITHLAEKYPEVLGKASDSVSNAVTKEKAPLFVAAYFSDVIDGLEKNARPSYIAATPWKNIQEHWRKGEKMESLIFAYNPTLVQVAHINLQMQEIKSHRRE
jgi:hypothetical protein